MGKFSHKGSGGQGHTVELSISYPITQSFSLGFYYSLQQFRITNGRDITHVQEFGEQYKSVGILNEVRSDASKLLLYLSYIFDLPTAPRPSRIREKMRRVYR